MSYTESLIDNGHIRVVAIKICIPGSRETSVRNHYTTQIRNRIHLKSHYSPRHVVLSSVLSELQIAECLVRMYMHRNMKHKNKYTIR